MNSFPDDEKDKSTEKEVNNEEMSDNSPDKKEAEAQENVSEKGEAESQLTEEEKKNKEIEDLKSEITFYERKIKNLEDDLRKYKNESEAYKERLTKINFEYENYRTRTAKEKEEIKDKATVDVLKVLLPSFDALERADASQNNNVDALKEGIHVTLEMFKASLAKLNLEEVPSGELNPSFHEVVFHQGDTEHPNKKVKQVLQKGYKFIDSDKVLRHAMVVTESVDEE